MNKMIAAAFISTILSGCYPLIQDHSNDGPPCESCRAAALAIIAGGGLQTPAPQPYHLTVTPMMPLGPVYNVHLIP